MFKFFNYSLKIKSLLSKIIRCVEPQNTCSVGCQQKGTVSTETAQGLGEENKKRHGFKVTKRNRLKNSHQESENSASV